MEVLFYLFRYHWGKENRSSYGGLRYIEVPLYFRANYIHTLS